MSQAYVVNGVIVSDDGRTVQYRTRCPKCGYVDTSTLYTCGCSEGGIVNRGQIPCTKCSNNDNRVFYFDIQLRRGY